MTRAERSAALAEAVYATGRTRFRARVRARIAVSRRHRTNGRLVSFSGLDGAGKSSQAEALQQTLERLGFDVAVQWTRLEWTTLWENRWLGVLGWPARATLALLSRLRRTAGASAARAGEAARPLEPSALRERSALISHVWVAIVALAHAAAQRRETRGHLRAGKIVICDRYTLDTAVHLRFRYGERRNYRFQTGLVDRLSPRPIATYLLDVPATTAHARKAEQYSLKDLERQAILYGEEWSRLRVRRLDGELPRAQLCAEIATEVWRALRGR
jgi:thymidylate kinase